MTTDGPGDCAREPRGDLSGSWSAKKYRIASLGECVARCQNCTVCHWVAFSQENDDCSWYRRCDQAGQLAFGGETYQSVQVRAVEALSPPPTLAHAQFATRGKPGYCALMDSALGSCDHDDQGSWPDVNHPQKCIQQCRACARCRFISTTLHAYANGSAVPMIRGDKMHWWACRWFAHCSLDRLLRPPPHAGEYVSFRVDRHNRTNQKARAGALVHTAVSGTEELGSLPRPCGELRPTLQLAVATLLFPPEGAGNMDVWSGWMCVLLQWIQNANRLMERLPCDWMAEMVVLVPPNGTASGWGASSRLEASTGRFLRIVEIPTELVTAAKRCTPRLVQLDWRVRPHPPRWRLDPLGSARSPPLEWRTKNASRQIPPDPARSRDVLLTVHSSLFTARPQMGCLHAEGLRRGALRGLRPGGAASRLAR